MSPEVSAACISMQRTHFGETLSSSPSPSPPPPPYPGLSEGPDEYIFGAKQRTTPAVRIVKMGHVIQGSVLRNVNGPYRKVAIESAD